MTAAIDGSEEVWSAILASTLTHIAVFVPMLFLTGVSSIMFGQLAAVVSFSLAMSLLVAVTIVPVLCSRYLDAPHVAHGKTGVMASLSRTIDGWLNDLDDFYARMLHKALAHRPTVFATGFALFAVTMVLMGRIGFEFQPQTDEGEVQVDVELAVGSRIERTEAVMLGLEDRVRQLVPEAVRFISQAGGGGFGGGSMHRGNVNILLVPRNERDRTNQEIAMRLRRELSGIPGVIVRARPSGGQYNMMRGMAAAATAACRSRSWATTWKRRRPSPRISRRCLTRRPALPIRACSVRKAGPSSPFASIVTRPRCWA